MSETKFTPGPWHVQKGFNTIFTTSDPAKQTGITIAIAKVLDDQVGSQSECNANASLIAAAPDLYEALKEVLLAERLGTRPPETAMQAEEKLDRIKYAVNKAEAALAKARGEQ